MSNFFDAILGIGIASGMYCWGKNKGHEKATFQYEAKNQQKEIDELRKQINDMNNKLTNSFNKSVEIVE